MSKSKSCPICKAEHFAMDVLEGSTGWIFCANCYQSARQSGMFSKIQKAINEAKEHHKNSVIEAVTA